MASRGSVLLVSMMLWSAGCEQSAAPPSSAGSPSAPLEAASPAVSTLESPDQVFIEGTAEQRAHLVSMRLLMWSGGEDAEAVKVLTQLFYSEPASLIQLGAGIELARQLDALEQREAALHVLDEMEAVELDPNYGTLLWLQIARLRVTMAQPERARATYARVLEHAPRYMFIHAELAAMDDEAAPERYETWRTQQIEALAGPSRAEALDLLGMALYDPEIERAMRGVVDGRADEAARSRAATWLQTRVPPLDAHDMDTQSARGGDDEAR